MRHIFTWLIYSTIIGLLITGCRSAAQSVEPAATVIPFPTFTATPAKTPVPIATNVSPTSTPLAALDPNHPSLLVAFSANQRLSLWTEKGTRTLTTVDDYSPVAISDDGQFIAFQRDGALWAIDTNDLAERQLIGADEVATLPIAESTIDAETLTASLNRFDWMPGTHTLLFNTTLVATYDTGAVMMGYNDDLYSMDIDRGERKQLAAPSTGGDFYPSPDRQWIALVAPNQITLQRPDGSEQRKLLDVPTIMTYSEGHFYPQLNWSPDSQSMIVVIPPAEWLGNFSEPTTLYRLWTNGNPPTTVSQLVIGNPQVAISPDLAWLIYARPPAQPPSADIDFHLARIDGSDDNSFYSGQGSRAYGEYRVGAWSIWSPDSTHFLYIGDRGETLYLRSVNDLSTVNLGGIHANELTRFISTWVDATHFLYYFALKYHPDRAAFQTLYLGEVGGTDSTIAGPVDGYIRYDSVQIQPGIATVR